MRARWIAVASATALALAARAAHGDPVPAPSNDAPLHLHTSSHLVTDGGADLRLPPGYFLDEPAWTRLDAEVRRLQDQETRLTAENRSMRASLDSWEPGWWTLAGAIAAGAAIGWYAHEKL